MESTKWDVKCKMLPFFFSSGILKNELFYFFFPLGTRSSWYSDYSCPITIVCVLSQGNCAWFVVLCAVLKLFAGYIDQQWALLSSNQCAQWWQEARTAEPCLELLLPSTGSLGPWKQWQFCMSELTPKYYFHCCSCDSKHRVILSYVKVWWCCYFIL